MNTYKLLEWLDFIAHQRTKVVYAITTTVILYGNKNSNAGDANYDHIVPVIGIGSSHPLDDKFYENDHILFSDNGLVTNNGNNPAIPKNNNVPYYYHYSFEEFVGSRKKANELNGNIYTLVNLPKNERGDSIFNYAIAITGIMGEKETLPIRIKTSLNYEAPKMKNNNRRPESMLLELNVTISKLKEGKEYIVYRYDNEENVPSENIKENPRDYVSKFRFKNDCGKKYSYPLHIRSNEKFFLRCVQVH